MATATLEEVCDSLRRLADEAEQAGDYDAAINAVEWIGRFSGLYVERRAVTYEGMSKDDAIAVLAGEDELFREALRRMVRGHAHRHLVPVS